MKKIEEEQESWDKKKIIIALLIAALLGGLLYAAKIFVLGKNINIPFKYSTTNKSQEKVEGISTKNNESDQEDSTSVSLPLIDNLKGEASQKLEEVKREINNLSISELASSSPQVKKIIQDVQGLEQAPKNQAKEACYNICKSL
ncbi:hypothetical protein C4559_05720 [Candidatus Microgenomates bacterium]|nr:MAG: hypothetical protein C4559_05720 [Candidatus Microgenomates bacterium]